MAKVQTLEGHRKFVQGVTVHPNLKYIVSASSDATVRVYKNRKLKNQIQFFPKFTVKNREDEAQEESKKKSQRLFLDDLEYSAFARRLCFSPDGLVVLTPAS